MTATRDEKPTVRKSVDLLRLPPVYRYTIAVVVVVAVVGLALVFRRPTPSWFQGVIPVLGWIGVAALFFLAARWAIKRR